MSTVSATWIRTLRVGAALVFWSILLPPVLANSVGFFASLLGAGPSSYRWVGWLDVAAYVPLLVGVWLLTRRPNEPAVEYPRTDLATGLRGFAVLGAISGLGAALSVNAHVGASTWLLSFVHVVGVILGLLWIRSLTLAFGGVRLAQRLALYIGIYVLFRVLILIPARVELLLPGVLVVGLVVGTFAAGLVLLHQFRRVLRAVSDGRCVECGYLLTGLPEPRCPECGTKFLRVVPD